jgi:peptidoglycan/LPS O-acetylase OafA/YrhL
MRRRELLSGAFFRIPPSRKVSSARAGGPQLMMTNTMGRTPAPVLRNVQGLRAVAALLVVLVHASLAHIGVEDVLARGEHPWLGVFRYIGLFGVDLFFVISGFIMLVTNWNSFSRPNAGARFFARRAIRIYPPYWLALAPILPVYFLARHQLMISHVGVKVGIIESILLVPQKTHFILPVAWTLVWEMIFYVVFSQFLRLDRRYLPAALGIWFVVELIFNVAFAGSPNFYLSFIGTPLPIEFILGAGVGILYTRRSMPAALPMAALAIVATAAVWTAVCVFHIKLDPPDIVRVALFGPPAALLVYSAVALERSGAFRVSAAIASIGDASYAMYLWHVSILVAMRQVIQRIAPSGPLAHAFVIASTLAIVVLVGLAVYRYFEKPVTARLNRLLDARLPGRITVQVSPIARIERTSA